MRYIVGIDLGTTNCAMAYVDTEHPSLPIQQFSIPQLSGSGKVDSLSTLPSFCYLASSGEWPPGALNLPWKEEESTFVGQMAKSHGARVPTKLIQSAKSWLCNVAANRREKILPIDASDHSRRLSPVEASSNYLIHLRDAWNASYAKGNPSLELEEQAVILTVPASFDEVARNLTVEAARLAGLNHLTLIEEPQAAFYSWISHHEQAWKQKFKAGETILVCDVGGGTTDFSLIEIQEINGELSFQRMAVGDHLLLGGDNIDAALAHQLEQKIGHHLESNQWLQLVAEARSAKEALLSSKNNQYTVSIQGTGSSVIKGSLALEISKEEVEHFLGEGFFGQYSLEEALKLKPSRGFRTMGLPYEDEPSITKHLAHFLKEAHLLESEKGIDYILFNGGTFKPEIFQKSVEASLNRWFPKTSLQRLETPSLDLAVSKGAAYYGKVRRGLGVSIGGGIPRTYYLKIEVQEEGGNLSSKALTLLPRGSEEGRTFQPSQTFSLRPNVPVAFHLLTSHVRLHDQEGHLIPIDPLEMQALPPIQTILRFGKKEFQEKSIPAKIGIRLTPIGTVELWLQSLTTEHKWDLEFQLRSAMGQEPHSSPLISEKNETFEKGFLAEAKKGIEQLLDGLIKPGQIFDHLEKLIGKKRADWGPSILRELWSPLLAKAPVRKKTTELEARWWNLAGYFLRPGFGFSLDDFRIKELWKIILGDLNKPLSSDCLIQKWICYRRIAGGLNKGQQMQLSAEMIDIFDKRIERIEIKRKGDLYPYSEKIRALASFERLELPLKIKMGEALLNRISIHPASESEYWALGRIGARHLFYGTVGNVITKEICERWIEKLLQNPSENQIALFRQLAKKTDHREINISPFLIQKILKAFPNTDLNEWLLEDKSLSKNDHDVLFGEQLPSGIFLISQN